MSSNKHPSKKKRLIKLNKQITIFFIKNICKLISAGALALAGPQKPRQYLAVTALGKCISVCICSIYLCNWDISYVLAA